MIVLHHLENSRSQRVLWLLEELGVAYEIKKYKRDPETSLAPPEMMQLHPLGKAPVVTDGENTLAESGAIIEYLVRHYDDGRLRPDPDSKSGMAYTYWLHYAEGSFMPLMILSLILGRIEAAPMPFFARPIARGIVKKVRDGYLDANVKRHLAFMNATLAESTWFCGDTMTAADIQMTFALEAAAVRTDLTSAYPYLAAFLDRAHSTPSYQRALETGGPYALLGGGDKG